VVATGSAIIGDAMGSDAAEGAGRAAGRIREQAKSLSSALTQAARVLEESAALAEEHAQRLEQAGRSGAAAKERQAAEHAREGAQRARSHAADWLGFSVDRER